MGRTKQEITAEMLWRYVEQVRTAAPEDSPPDFSREELLQLLDLLDFASQVPDALPGFNADDLNAVEKSTLHAEVRARVFEALNSQPVPEAEPHPLRDAPRLAWRPRSWGWALSAVAGAAATAGIVLATVNMWHHPAPEVVVRSIRVPSAAPDVQPMDENRAHELIPRLVGHQLERTEERSLMWHMLVCPGCYDAYVQMRQRDRAAATGSPIFAVHRR